MPWVSTVTNGGRVGLQNGQLVTEGKNLGLKGGAGAKTGDNEGKQSNQSWVHRLGMMISHRTEPVHFQRGGSLRYPQVTVVSKTLTRATFFLQENTDEMVSKRICQEAM